MIRRVAKSYRTGGAKVRALDGVDLAIDDEDCRHHRPDQGAGIAGVDEPSLRVLARSTRPRSTPA
jgi:hypothetical protein